MTVTDDPHKEKLFTAAELLDIVLAAYERGLLDAATQAARTRWNNSQLAVQLRNGRRQSEIRWMRERAATAYEARGLTAGYDYRGGSVDYDTGMPPRTPCAGLRRGRLYTLAGGSR